MRVRCVFFTQKSGAGHVRVKCMSGACSLGRSQVRVRDYACRVLVRCPCRMRMSVARDRCVSGACSLGRNQVCHIFLV